MQAKINSRDHPLVSTVIPAYNCSTTVGRTIESIANQSYPNIEILAVYDSGCVDATLEVLIEQRERLVSKGFPMRILKTPHVGRSAARNAGWRFSEGRILFFADSDEIYKDEYVAIGVKHLLSNDSGGVTITGSSWTPNPSLIGRVYTEVYTPLQRRKESSGKVDLNWAWIFRREAVEAVEGYDESLDQAEDRDLYIRMKNKGIKFSVIYGEHWYHQRPTTLDSYVRKTWFGATRRIRFSIKHRRFREIGINLAPVLGLGLIVVGLFLSRPLFITASSIFVLFIILTLVNGYRKVSFVSSPKLVAQFLLLQLLTRVLTSFGYLYGLALLIKRTGPEKRRTESPLVEL